MKLDITSIVNNNGGTIKIEMEEILEDLKTGIGTVSFTSPAKFSGHITNNNGMLFLKGLAKVDYRTLCDRCAQNIERELVIDVNEGIIEQGVAEEETDESYIDDRYTFMGNILDLGRIIADSILTGIPATQICQDNCPGLCSICGAQIRGEGCNCNETGQIDSRFEVLKGYFD